VDVTIGLEVVLTQTTWWIWRGFDSFC